MQINKITIYLSTFYAALYAFCIAGGNHRSNQALNLANHLSKKLGFLSGSVGFNSSVQSAGVNESAINADMITDIAIVIANCWYSLPTIPGINPTGTNTAAKIKGDGNYRCRNIFHSLVSSFFWRHFIVVDIMLHRFYHDNGIINHNTYRQHKAEHG